MSSSTKRKLKWATPERKKTRVEKEKEEEVEGFKFSRRSRRTKASGGRSQKKACESDVKKRRSSFVRGRKERKSLQPLISEKLGAADVFKDIHEDLPPKAKIRKTFDASLQFAIEKISEQGDLSASPNLKEQAKKVLQQLKNIISDSDIVEQAFTAKEENKQISAQDSNVVEAAIEQDTTNCQAVIERLKSEEEKWDDLLRKHQEKHDHMLKEYDANSVDEVPDFLSCEQHELLSGKPNLKGTLDRMMLLQQKAVLEVDEIAKVVQSLKKFTDVSSVFVEKQVESLGIASRNIVEAVGTPKTLIRGVLGRK